MLPRAQRPRQDATRKRWRKQQERQQIKKGKRTFCCWRQFGKKRRKTNARKWNAKPSTRGNVVLISLPYQVEEEETANKTQWRPEVWSGLCCDRQTSFSFCVYCLLFFVCVEFLCLALLLLLLVLCLKKEETKRRKRRGEERRGEKQELWK